MYTANSNDDFDVQEDFLMTLEKAQIGDCDAMLEVAYMYYYGFATKEDNNGCIDYKEAARWLFKAKEKMPDSFLVNKLLGKMYYYGAIPTEEQSFSKAIEYYKKANCIDQVCRMKGDGVGISSDDYNDIVDFYEFTALNCNDDVTKKSYCKVLYQLWYV